MTGPFGNEYKIVIESQQNVVSAQFRIFLKSIKRLLNNTKRKIPSEDISSKFYADFIEKKVFTGISKSNQFKLSSKYQIKNMIDGTNKPENEEKLQEMAMKLAVLESKNIESMQTKMSISDALESINSLDTILYGRLKRISSARMESKNNFVVITLNTTDDGQLKYSALKKDNNIIPKDGTIIFKNKISQDVQGYNYDKNREN